LCHQRLVSKIINIEGINKINIKIKIEDKEEEDSLDNSVNSQVNNNIKEEIVIIITKVGIETNLINTKINIKIQIIINHKIIVNQDKIKADNNSIIHLKSNSIHLKKDINKNNIKDKDNKIKGSQEEIKDINNLIIIETNKDKILPLNKEIKEVIRIPIII